MPKHSVTGVHLWLILMKAFRAIGARASLDMKGSGLGQSDFQVLEVLLHKGPMPVNAIGPKVFLTPGSISTAVDRLYKKGLVTRKDCAEDRRIRTVDLTPKGRALITRIFQTHAARMEELAGILTPQEREAIANGLKKWGKKAEQPAG